MDQSGRIMDPFQAEQEREKWMKKLTYFIVIILRFFVWVCKLILSISWEVVKNVLRTFKILPS